MSTPEGSPAQAGASGLELKIPPPVVALVAVAAMWGLAQVLPVVDLPRGMRLALAGVVALSGVITTGWGFAIFRRARTTVNPHHPAKSTSLVTSGPYRATRNPMYLGLLLVLAGWAVYLASLPALLGPVAFVLYIGRFQIAPEERVLQGLFGDEYLAYTTRVRRWL